MRILKAAGARATFFFVGNRLEGRVVGPRAVIAAGSEIGNHTYTHRMLKGITPRIFAAEVLRTQQLDERLFGLRPTLLRARGGIMDAASEKMASDAGLVVVDWSKAGQDTVPEAEPGYIASHAERARGGSIVLFHETRKETVQALPRVIKALQDRGLELVTVSELLAASK